MKYAIHKIFAGALIAGAGIITSCTSDYLNTTPTESVSPESAMATAANARNALNGIAKTMSTQYGATDRMGAAGENMVMRYYEDMAGPNYNFNYYAPGWFDVHNQTLHDRTDRLWLFYAWFYYYQVIGNANEIINKIDNATGSESDKKFVKASALTFRAYCYEKLIHYYCYRWEDSNNGTTLGLPLRLDDSTGDLKASTLDETFKQVYADCEEAIKLFEESGQNRDITECWIADLNTAHAVLARAALTKHDYQTALTHAVAAQQDRPLMDAATYPKGFYQPTSEWIFGSYGGEDEQLWYWSYGTFGACNGYFAENITGAGTISHELISRIPNKDARKNLFITEDKFEAINPFEQGDVDQEYGLIKKPTLIDEARKIMKARQIGGLGEAYPNDGVYLDAQMKFWVTAKPGVSYLPFIRSSEMVLIEAEANYFLKNEAATQKALEKLTKDSGRNPEYTCTKTGQELFNELKDYRDLELWGEGFAWSDYKRWNITMVRHSFKEGGNAHEAVAVTITPDHGNKWTWEIPKQESDFNTPLRELLGRKK